MPKCPTVPAVWDAQSELRRSMSRIIEKPWFRRSGPSRRSRTGRRAGAGPTGSFGREYPSCVVQKSRISFVVAMWASADLKDFQPTMSSANSFLTNAGADRYWAVTEGDDFKTSLRSVRIWSLAS